MVGHLHRPDGGAWARQGMGRPKEFDPDLALETAMEAFWENGFDATSLADITASTGVQKASLYATYGDKRQLFLTALSRYQEEGFTRLKAGLASKGSVRAAFHAVFSGMIQECATKDRSRGCLCVNTAVEIGPRDPEIAGMLLSHANRIVALFAETIERGQAGGEIDAGIDAQTTARFLLVTLFGVTVGGKTGFSARKLDEVVSAALSVLER
jgi:TetR/AcrR family transcriptional repressor of nem operon